MPRILGIDVPNDKHIDIALTYIHGIGHTSAKKIVKELDLDPQRNAGELSPEEISKIASHIDSNYIIEGELRRQTSGNIKRLMEIRCYRGIRHRKGLPVRGQRTRTNARTRKGKKKTVARKASVKELR